LVVGLFACGVPVTTLAVPTVPTSGLALWLKADAGVSGSPVSQWSDQSGNGRYAIQGAGDSQPVLVAGALNGKPVVRFDGVNDFMTFNLPVNGLGGDEHFLGVSQHAKPGGGSFAG
jgi:hypothetical protein